MTGSTYRRAVSGEIVTGRAAARLRPQPVAGDVIDAQFETIGGGGDAAAPGRRAAAPSRGLAFLTGGPASAPVRRGGRGGPAFWIAGLSIAAGALWMSGGHALFADVRFGDAEPGRFRVASFASRIDAGQGRAVLTVDGELANDGALAATVPPFSIDITTVDGATTRYYLAEGSRPVEPNGRFRFSSRLLAPRQPVENVSITLEQAPEARRPGARKDGV